MSVDPTAQQVFRFLKEDVEGPVVMLNCLRFRDDAGQAGYERYLEHLVGSAGALGGELIYYGIGSTVLVGAEGYDAVMLMRYPSRSAFVQMIRDPVFREFSLVRTMALSDAILQATVERILGWSGGR